MLQRNTPIYAVSVFDKDGVGLGDDIGFFHEFETADKMVRENSGDIYEYTNLYARIIEYHPDFYTNVNTLSWFYKFNETKDEYEYVGKTQEIRDIIYKRYHKEEDTKRERRI